jgi:hypothetical protein
MIINIFFMMLLKKRMITGTKTPRNIVFPMALLQSKGRDGDGDY